MIGIPGTVYLFQIGILSPIIQLAWPDSVDFFLKEIRGQIRDQSHFTM